MTAPTFTYRPPRGPPRRVVFEPRSGAGHWCVEQEWTGCTWRTVGREPVRDLHVEGMAPAETTGLEAAGRQD
jgi:hypothetical protein